MYVRTDGAPTLCLLLGRGAARTRHRGNVDLLGLGEGLRWLLVPDNTSLLRAVLITRFSRRALSLPLLLSLPFSLSLTLRLSLAASLRSLSMPLIYFPPRSRGFLPFAYVIILAR